MWRWQRKEEEMMIRWDRREESKVMQWDRTGEWKMTRLDRKGEERPSSPNCACILDHGSPSEMVPFPPRDAKGS